MGTEKGLKLVALLGLAMLTGCQSWSGFGYPFGNPSRVPPPGTGTYQLPPAYYSNAGGAPPSPSDVSSFGPTGVAPTGTNGMPPTGVRTASAQSSFPSTGSSAPVSSAQFTAPTYGNGSGTRNPSSLPTTTGSAASRSLSDTPPADVPTLDWQ